MRELTQSESVQDYLYEIDRLNSYAKISDATMINIIINKFSGSLRCSMAHNEHLRSIPTEWWSQRVRMENITTEFQRRDKYRRQDKNQECSKKGTFEDRIQRKAGWGEKTQSSSNNRDFVPQDQIDRRKTESCCFTCSRKNQQAVDCEYCWESQRPPLKDTSNPNQEPGNKKAWTDKGPLLIIEVGYENDSGNEWVVCLPPSNVLRNIPAS